jgi:hypothetical protein
MKVQLKDIGTIFIESETEIEEQYLNQMHFATIEVDQPSNDDNVLLIIKHRNTKLTGLCPSCGSDSICGYGDSKESRCNECGTFWLKKKNRHHFENFIRHS